jgi:asparagine synthase (glutamine-hydrolysing)
VIRLDGDFFREFPRYAEKSVYVTDGCHHVCGSQDIFLNERAREIASICVMGIFGGEVMRSGASLKADPPSRELFDAEFYHWVVRGCSTVVEAGKGRPLTNSVFKSIPWGMYGVLCAEQSQITLRSPYLDNELVGLMFQAPKDFLFSKEISLRLIAEGNPNLCSIVTDRGVDGRRTFILSKLYELYYYSLFKLDWYYGVGMPHWLTRLDYAVRPLHIERVFLGKQRIDHYRIWFQNELAEYVREILVDRATIERPYLNRLFLERMVESHARGRGNYTNEINRALTVELIERLLIEKP